MNFANERIASLLDELVDQTGFERETLMLLALNEFRDVTAPRLAEMVAEVDG